MGSIPIGGTMKIMKIYYLIYEGNTLTRIEMEADKASAKMIERQRSNILPITMKIHQQEEEKQ